jgi:hypothetical protein
METPMSEHDPRDYRAFRDLPDGRHLDVMPLTFGRARLAVSSDDGHTGIDDVYDYEDELTAIAAMSAWDGTGDPVGWSRAAGHDDRVMGFRRRSDPADANTEEVRE